MQNGTFNFQEFCKQVGEGAKPSDFEFTWGTKKKWFNASNTVVMCSLLQPDAEFRKVQKMIVCNGWSIPAPMENTPSEGSDYCYPDVSFHNLCGYGVFHKCGLFDHRIFERGFMHSSHENAARHACAMMNIDPDRWESFQ